MPYIADKKVNTSIRKKTIFFLKKTLHLVPFFLGFILSRFFQLSFANDLFLIGILISAGLLFFVRDKVNEPSYKEDFK